MPDWKDEIRERLAGLGMEPAREAAIVEELSQHLEDCFEEMLSGGAAPADAERLTRAELSGNELLASELRRAGQQAAPEPIILGSNRRINMLADLWQDLRYGARILLKQPGFTFVVVLTLALGIGANTAIFSIVNAVLLRPLAYADPERLVQVWEDRRAKNDPHHPVAPANFLDWRAQNTVFERIGAIDPLLGFNLTGPEGPERIKAARVSADLLPLFGVAPILGRSFLPQDEQTGGKRVAIVSHGLWQRRYGSDPGIIGQAVSLNGQSFTVVGVTPPDFRFPQGEFDLALPLAFKGWERAERETHPLRVYARLKAGVTLRQAQAELGAIARRLTEQYPQTNTGKGITLVPLHEQVTGDSRTALLVLLGAVGFVLLIACANVANLLLARSLARQKEFSVRLALGAGRGRLIRQLLTEGVLLASMGGIAGLLLALWGRRVLVSLLVGAELIPRWMEVKLDERVLLFTLVSALLTGLVSGLAPALTATKADLNQTLREGGRKSTAGKRDRRFRHALVISEIALALMLLVGAGLMIQSFRRLTQVDPGFRPEHILALELTLPNSRYPRNYQASDFYERLLERIGALPGVRSAGGTAYLPLSGTQNWFRSFDIEGRPPLPPEIAETEWRLVTAGYFRTMGIPLTRGRDFTQQDGTDSPRAVLINERMAQLYWPGEDPTGRRLKLREPGKEEWYTVVGVVGAVRHFGLANEPKSEMYFLYAQTARPWYPLTLVIRAESDPAQLASTVRRAVLDLDPDLPIYNIRTMEELVAQSAAPTRLHLLMFGVFGAVALILAASGLYGVMSYTVTQRMNEIGIRMALGAQKRNVRQLIIVQGMGVTLVGVAFGLFGAYVVTRLMSSLLFGVGATDPLTFALASAVLSATALAACYLPARRATKVDPLIALRYE